MENQKKPWYKIWWVWLIILVILGSIFGEDNCGCSDSDLVDLQRSMAISKEEAREICCEWEKALEDY